MPAQTILVLDGAPNVAVEEAIDDVQTDWADPLVQFLKLSEVYLLRRTSTERTRTTLIYTDRVIRIYPA